MIAISKEAAKEVKGKHQEAFVRQTSTGYTALKQRIFYLQLNRYCHITVDEKPRVDP